MRNWRTKSSDEEAKRQKLAAQARYSKKNSSQTINPIEVQHKMKAKLDLSPFEFSPVDIIVPFHGQYQKVTRLIESIYRVTRPPFLLTLVDDASKNPSYIEDIKENTNVNCIRNEKQLGFGGSLAVGFKQTKFPWVIFMDSDCHVDNTQWLNKLGETMLKLKDQGVKMVSARYPNSGSDIEKLSSPQRAMTDIEDIILSKNDYLPLTCVLAHRELFSRINGFVKEYPYGWYEDQELAYRMNFHGFKQAICTKSWIYHDGMSTLKELWQQDPEIKEIMINNEKLCLEDIKKLKNN